MPFPFFAHQAAVVPLKLRAPRSWSGTGLVLGSMAPDFGYFLTANNAASRLWHRPLGAFVLCLPLSLALYWLVTRVLAEPVARQLPMLGGFRLKALGWVAAQPRGTVPWIVVATSILAGVVTHLAWDLFTHTGSWMGEYVPFLERRIYSLPGYHIVGSDALWTLSTIVGGAATLVALWHIGRHDLVRHWAEARTPGSTAGLDPLAAPAMRGFWLVVALATSVGGAAGYFTRPEGFLWFERATWAIVFFRATVPGFVALCIAAIVERRRFASLTART